MQHNKQTEDLINELSGRPDRKPREVHVRVSAEAAEHAELLRRAAFKHEPTGIPVVSPHDRDYIKPKTAAGLDSANRAAQNREDSEQSVRDTRTLNGRLRQAELMQADWPYPDAEELR